MRQAVREIIDMLGARLTLVLLLVFAAAFVLLFPLSEHFASVRAESHLNTLLQQQLESRSSSLSRHIDLLKRDVVVMSQITSASAVEGRMAAGEALKAEQKQRLQQDFLAYMRQRQEVRQLRIISAVDAGQELVRVDRLSSGKLWPVADAELQNKASRDYYIESMARDDRGVYASAINLNRELGRIEMPLVPTLRLITPMFDKQQRKLGLMVMNVDFSFSEHLLNVDLPAGLNFYLLNASGDFLLHPDESKRYAFEFGEPFRWEQQFDLPLKADADPYSAPDSAWHVVIRRMVYDRDHSLFFVLAANDHAIGYSMGHSRNLNLLTFGAFLLFALVLILQFLVNTRRREAAIAKNAELLAIIEGSTDAVLGLNNEAEITSWNPAAEGMFGYTAEEALGKSVSSLIVPDDRHGEFQFLERTLKAGQAVPPFETLRQDRDGRLIEVSVNVSPMRGENGQIIGAASIIRDIREIRKTQAKLRKLNLELEEQVAERTRELRSALTMQEAILERAGYGIVVTSPNGRIRLFNPAAEQMLGYRAEEVVDKKSLTEFFVGRDFWDAVDVTAEVQGGKLDTYALLREGFQDEREWVFSRRDGSEFPVLLKTSSLVGSSDDLGFLTIIIDLTHRKAEQQELEQAKLAAEEASRAKSEFLANMSHEIRTPMNAVLGILTLLKQTELDERQSDYVRKAGDAAGALLGIINDVLDFSKIEAGKMQLDPQWFSFEQLLRDVANILSMQLDEARLELLFDIDPDIPARLLGDALRIKQVLLNLAGNALKFTEQGEVTVGILVQYREGDEVVLGISVRDTGIGMTAQQQLRVFQSFTQAEAGTTRRYGGTGLGLVVSQRLIRLMGGELELESKEAQGSVFSFSLPLKAEAAALRDACRGGERQQIRRILLVEDNTEARHVARRACESLGWVCEEAASAAEALEILRGSAQTFDAALIDWVMPEMDGCELAAELRGGVAPYLKLILVTAHSWETYPSDGRSPRELFDGLLAKPVTACDIYRAVEGSLGTLLPAPFVKPDERPAVQSLRGLTILLVEDNPTNQQVARELLALEGAQIVLAENGRIAVEILSQRHDIDVVLMDLQMPEMDGFTASRKIRQELALTSLPIIAMTANAMPSDRQACLEAGMDDHVGKPFELPELVASILQACSRKPFIVTPKVTDSVAEEPEPDLLSSPPGFDLKAALLRMGNRTSLLMEQLSYFAKHHCDSLQAVHSALESGDRDKVVRLLHALRGAAATLGASALADSLLRAEQLCGEEGKDPAAAIEEARQLLDEACEVFQAVAEANQDNGDGGDALAPVDEQAMRVLANELQQLLKQNNMRAVSVFQQMKTRGLGRHPIVREIEPAMIELNFCSAAEALGRWLAGQPEQGA